MKNEYKLLLHSNHFFRGGYKSKTETEIAFIMSEQFNRPENHLKYLKDEHYHSIDKGCDTEMKIVRTQAYTDISVQRYCHTHNCLCSKSGWEMGWFSGQQLPKTEYSNGTPKFFRTYELLKSSKNLQK